MSTSPGEFFNTGGGTLDAEAPSYVARMADDQLYDGLSRGEYCYVLTARQTGKSSLALRIAERLRAEGTAVAQLDLTTLGGWHAHVFVSMSGSEMARVPGGVGG